MIVVHASFPIKPDKRDKALDVVTDIVEHSQAEAGTIDYRATIDVNDQNVIRFLEQYEDAAAFEAHSQSDHFQEFEAMLPELLADDPDITRRKT